MNKTFRTYSLCLTGHMISIPASYLPTSYPGKILLSTALASLLMFWSLAKSLGSSSLYAEHLKVSASKLRLRQGRQMLCEQWVVTGLYTMSMHTMHPNIFSTKSVTSFLFAATFCDTWTHILAFFRSLSINSVHSEGILNVVFSFFAAGDESLFSSASSSTTKLSSPSSSSFCCFLFLDFGVFPSDEP